LRFFLSTAAQFFFGGADHSLECRNASMTRWAEENVMRKNKISVDQMFYYLEAEAADRDCRRPSISKFGRLMAIQDHLLNLEPTQFDLAVSTLRNMVKDQQEKPDSAKLQNMQSRQLFETTASQKQNS
jgi:hypothetical protein